MSGNGSDVSTNAVMWARVCAAAILMTDRCVAAEIPWRVVEQPDLKQAIEKAPVLRSESLGEPERGVNVWERWLVPNPDGK